MRLLILPIMQLLFSACGAGSDADGSAQASAARAAATQVAISAVQGAGSASPLAGSQVIVTGVVTGDFQDNDHNGQNNLGGFYLQSLAADEDPRSSEGLFVFDRDATGPDVATGDRVQVAGTVGERFGETQLKAATVEIVGRAKPSVQVLELPVAGTTTNSDGVVIADLEHLEGMLVSLPQTLYVQDLAGLERYGEILLSLKQREYQFTSTERPDQDRYREHRAQVAARALLLDDGRAEQNVKPIRYVAGDGLPGRAPRLGDAARSVRGVLRYSRGSGPNGVETWRLMPTGSPEFVVQNPRTSRPKVDASLVVGSFNLLNYFSTLDNGERRCGPARDEGCRGADSAQELARQRQRTANSIIQSGAELIGVMELENNPRAAVEDLAAALRRAGGDWQYVDTGIIGSDVIRVAFLYRAERVRPVGEFAILDSQTDKRFNDRRNRPALAQTFRALENAGRFTVAVTHLKSKGSPCDDDGDPNQGDGQGNCNLTRRAAALALADWLQDDPTGSGDGDVLIIGDLNAYMREDPVLAFEGAGYRNLLREHVGDAARTVAFRGESGALDHAFASPSLAAQVSATAEWHSNADEAPVYDYNLDYGRDPRLFDAQAPWRASDHDPLLIGLRLQPD